MQNDTVLLAVKIGTTDAASSEVQPITNTRFDVEAYIWRTAGTASAGSPRVSTLLQLSVCPSTPPALSIAFVAASQDTRYVGPSAASGPVNGATSATVNDEPAAVAADPPESAAATAATATAPAAAARSARRVRSARPTPARAAELHLRAGCVDPDPVMFSSPVAMLVR